MLSGIVINVLYPFPYFKFQSGGQIGFPVQSEIFVFEEKGSLIGTFLLMWKVLLVKELLLYFSFLAHSIISDRSPVCGSLVCNWNTNDYILYLSAKDDQVDLNNPLVESFFIPGKLVEPSVGCFHCYNLVTNLVSGYVIFRNKGQQILINNQFA